jgi:hypothetical protein
MQNIANDIRTLVARVTPLLAQLSADEAAEKPQPEKWSKKEILGHLIDSAANNHQRFVRAGYKAALDFPAYAQNEWVRIQGHQEGDWSLMVELWSAYNRYLCGVLERLPAEASSELCNFGKEGPVPLEEVVKGYQAHLRHHVAQLVE